MNSPQATISGISIGRDGAEGMSQWVMEGEEVRSPNIVSGAAA